MARTFEMTWNAKQRRWFKKHRNRQYSVSPKELGTPTTKEASGPAANEWWRRKKAELDLLPAGPYRRDYERTVELLAAKRDWCRLHGQPSAAERFAAKVAELETRLDSREPPEIEPELLDLKLVELAEKLDVPVPAAVRERLNARPDEAGTDIWLDRLRNLRTDPVPHDFTVGAQAADWLKLQRTKAEGGEVAPDRYDNVRCGVHYFRDFVGADRPVTDLAEKTLEMYFSRLMAKVSERRRDRENKAGFSADYAATLFGTARRFVRWCWTMRLIELPRNIDARDHRFGKAPKRIEFLEDREVRFLLDNAGDRLRLYLLLMLNCGMLQKDISDLRHEEVDWERGRIRRKRSKTKDHGDVPEVDYMLWPETFRLLKLCRSDPRRHESVLVTEKGRALMPKGLADDGRLTKSDNIQSAYRYLGKRLGIKKLKPLRLIRKTSASKLEAHPEYGRYGLHFLGHSPRTVKDRHYAAPSRELFDTIIAWLGKQYGLA